VAAHSAAAEPSLKMFFQERMAIGGMLASAVNNPHAAECLPQAVPNELFELTTSIQNAQSMQVQVCLNGKLAVP
jgi:hypothetical protein